MCKPGKAVTHVKIEDPNFVVFLHETGHVLGAIHTYEEGQMTTGGIMDAGDSNMTTFIDA